jgi:hypothetical protein
MRTGHAAKCYLQAASGFLGLNLKTGFSRFLSFEGRGAGRLVIYLSLGT